MKTKKDEAPRAGLHLLPRERGGRRGLWRVVFSRVGLISLLLLIELLLFLVLVLRAAEAWPPILGGTVLLSLLMAFYLLNVRMDPTAKITWLLVIMFFPVLGAVLFLYTRSDIGHRLLRRRVADVAARSREQVPETYPAREAFLCEDSRAAALLTYLCNSGAYPVYDRTAVTYFPSGEEKLAALLAELEKAERFIFLEYFIIAEGEMWGQILAILARKAQAGVDVRVMYDGTCAFSTLSFDYPARLRRLGIKCKIYAPLTPFVSTYYNYRDHRKILVVDGRVAFNGGVNLADEYINAAPRFGHWKDAAVMLRGDAVASFTRMFLDMWSLDEREPAVADHFFPHDAGIAGQGGFLIPYGDCPLDDDKVGERVYADILARAEHYVHIMTPYLVLDGEMENALRYAAERGVEVALILPGIPDKKMAYALAKTYYPSLLAAGVRIYEYTPGFVHAKVMVADGREAVVGTINLDYRSFYHHFECATYLYRVPCIANIEADFTATREKCRTVTQESLKKEKISSRLCGMLMKALAPLM
jgi:cardiolipin synthase